MRYVHTTYLGRSHQTTMSTNLQCTKKNLRGNFFQVWDRANQPFPARKLSDTRGMPKLKEGLIDRESVSWSQNKSTNNNAFRFPGRPPFYRETVSVFHESAVISYLSERVRTVIGEWVNASTFSLTDLESHLFSLPKPAPANESQVMSTPSTHPASLCHAGQISRFIIRRASCRYLNSDIRV